MTTTKLIGLCGFKGAGKSSVTASAIFNPATSFISLPIYQTNFAKPIFDMLAAIVPGDIMYNKARWDEPLPELDGKTVRFAADTLGVDWGRNRMGRNIWINQMRIEIGRSMATGAHVIVDNIRFPDEFDMMKELCAETIAFHRPALGLPWNIGRSPTERYISDIQARCGHSIVNREGHFAESVLEMRALLKRIIET
jgi:hypothetical protein